VKHFFAYGTLIFPPVLEALLGHETSSETAQLPDHAAFTVRGEVYPAAVEEPGTQLKGRLYAGLDDADWNLLDAFEGDLYERTPVHVATDSGPRQNAELYRAVPRARDRLTMDHWDPRVFSELHREDWLASCRNFAAAFSR
jgi:gamma-glutamylcyclotransferase (GGCT)/AIG2-like uncharacterized protein YtfP